LKDVQSSVLEQPIGSNEEFARHLVGGAGAGKKLALTQSVIGKQIALLETVRNFKESVQCRWHAILIDLNDFKKSGSEIEGPVSLSY
jgi:hypothetical protein